MGNYMGTSDAAEKWGHPQAAIAKLCRDGKIKGAEQDGKGTTVENTGRCGKSIY